MDLTATTTTMGTYTTSGTLAFMQDSFTEGIVAAIITLIGNNYATNKVYILYGCLYEIIGSDVGVSPGAIFYNGEIFINPGGFFPGPTGGNVILCNLNIANTYLEPDGITNIDPANYEDGTPRNTYNIRTAKFSTGPSGSGSITGDSASDYSNMVVIFNPYSAIGLALEGGWANAGGSYYPATFKLVDGNQCVLSGYIEHPGSMSVGTVNVMQLPFALTSQVAGTVLINTSGGYITVPYFVTTAGMLFINPLGTVSGVLFTIEGISFRIA